MKEEEPQCILIASTSSYIIPSARDPNIPQENFRLDNSFRKVTEYKYSFYFFLF